MTAAWNKNEFALQVCPEKLRAAVLERVARIDSWIPWTKGSLPDNPYIMVAPSASPEKRPAPDGWVRLGDWDPGELYALRSHFHDGDSAWILYCGPSKVDAAPDLIAIGDVLL